MPVTLGGGRTMGNGTRSPPRRSERAASAAKHSCFIHCTYTSGSVVAGSYRSDNSAMGTEEQERAPSASDSKQDGASGASGRSIFALAKIKRAASLRLACHRRRNADLLGASRVAEVGALTVGIAGRVDARVSYVRFAWMRDVIALGYARGCYRRATGSIPAERPLARRTTPLGESFRVLSGVAQLCFLTHPPILQVDLRIRVPIRLLRCALTPATGAHGASFPARFRQRGIALFHAS